MSAYVEIEYKCSCDRDACNTCSTSPARAGSPDDRGSTSFCGASSPTVCRASRGPESRGAALGRSLMRRLADIGSRPEVVRDQISVRLGRKMTYSKDVYTEGHTTPVVFLEPKSQPRNLLDNFALAANDCYQAEFRLGSCHERINGLKGQRHLRQIKQE